MADGFVRTVGTLAAEIGRTAATVKEVRKRVPTGNSSEELLRAAESVVSPLGWREGDVIEYTADKIDVSIAAFGGFRD